MVPLRAFLNGQWVDVTFDQIVKIEESKKAALRAEFDAFRAPPEAHDLEQNWLSK